MASAGAGVERRPAGSNRRPLIALTCHVFLLTAVTAGYAVTEVTAPSTPDANIGGGLLLWRGLGALGLPWSVLFFDVVDNERDNTVTALMVTFALANLLIHGLLALYLTSRSAASRRRQPVGADAIP